jgi:hypothetical protein
MSGSRCRSENDLVIPPGGPCAFEQRIPGAPTRSEAETRSATALAALPFGSMSWMPDRYFAAALADSR